MTSGVYEIYNTRDGRRYIGSSARIEHRWQKHRTHLAKGVHHSRFLQRASDKHGIASFEFRVVLVCAPDRSELLRHEQAAIDGMQPEYNSCKVAGSPLGYKHPPEFGAAISRRQIGKKCPPQVRAAISKRFKGIPLSAAHREKLSKAKVGIKLRPQHKNKIGRAHTGKPKTAAHVASMAAARTGKPHITKAARNLNWGGETASAAQWAQRAGIKYNTLLARLYRGWSVERALTTGAAA